MVIDLSIQNSSLTKTTIAHDQVDDLKAALMCLETDSEAPLMSQVSIRNSLKRQKRKVVKTE